MSQKHEAIKLADNAEHVYREVCHTIDVSGDESHDLRFARKTFSVLLLIFGLSFISLGVFCGLSRGGDILPRKCLVIAG
jgi:hypothetical protein